MNRWLRNLVLLLQIGGGLWGVGLVGRLFLAEDLTQIAMIIHGAFILVFLFGILAGVALIKKPILGLVLSVIYQGIQIPIIILPAVAYTMFSGATWNVYWHETGWGTNLFFGGRFYFYINGGQPWCAGVNILALALFLLLIREIWLQATFSKISVPELPEIPSGPVYRPSFRQ